MTKAVEFQDVSFAFDDLVILDHVSFTIETGAMRVLLGRGFRRRWAASETTFALRGALGSDTTTSLGIQAPRWENQRRRSSSR